MGPAKRYYWQAEFRRMFNKEISQLPLDEVEAGMAYITVTKAVERARQNGK